VAERADDRPRRVWIAEQLPVAQRDAGEEVQRVPEQRGLRRRADEQLPIDPRAVRTTRAGRATARGAQARGATSGARWSPAGPTWRRWPGTPTRPPWRPARARSLRWHRRVERSAHRSGESAWRRTKRSALAVGSPSASS
jgi:hypothetical protein